MGVVAITKSGNAVRFVTDEGDQYLIAVSRLQGYLTKKDMPFIPLTRLPDPVSPDRYPKSTVYSPDGSLVPAGAVLTTGNDALSQKVAKEKAAVGLYVDKEVVW